MLDQFLYFRYAFFQTAKKAQPPQHTIENKKQYLQKAYFSADNQTLLTLSSQHQLSLWNLSTYQPRETPTYSSCSNWSHQQHNSAIAVHHQKNIVACAGTSRHAMWGVANHYGEPDEVVDEMCYIEVIDIASQKTIAKEFIDDYYPEISWISFWQDDLVILRGQEISIYNHKLYFEDSTEYPGYLDLLLCSACGTAIVGVEARYSDWDKPRIFQCYNRQTSQWQQPKEIEMDPFNGFGIPLSSNEGFPKYQFFVEEGELKIMCSSDNQVVKAIDDNCICRVAVQPGTSGTCFATYNICGELVYWQEKMESRASKIQVPPPSVPPV